MTTQIESTKNIYTRKVTGEKYEYEVQYTPGKRVTWDARVYHNGNLKGTPSGVLDDNELSGEVLRQNIITLVECTIEVALGIDE